DGTFLWVRQIGGPSVEYGYDFAVTPSGQSFVTGHFSDRASFDGANAVASSYYDIFIASYRADGDLAWLRTPTGTAGGSSGHCMALDSDTNVFVSGFFSGRADFGATNLTATGSDIFLAKYDSTGRFQWAKRFDVSPGSGSGE